MRSEPVPEPPAHAVQGKPVHPLPPPVHVVQTAVTSTGGSRKKIRPPRRDASHQDATDPPLTTILTTYRPTTASDTSDILMDDETGHKKRTIQDIDDVDV